MIFACISFFGIMSKRTFCLHYCTESFTWIAWVHSFRSYIPFFDHFQLISVCGELGEWNAFSQCDLLMSIPAWKDMKAVLKISWLNILNLSSRKQKCLTWSSWKKQNSFGLHVSDISVSDYLAMSLLSCGDIMAENML